MDNTTQQNPVQHDTGQPAASVVQQPIQATSSTSIGPGSEGEPIRAKLATEYASQPEVKLHPEVAAAGVETVNADEIAIPPEAAAAGMTPAKEATPITSHPNWPMTPQKANTILTSPHLVIKNAAVWLATVIKKMVKKESLAPVKEEVNVSDNA